MTREATASELAAVQALCPTVERLFVDDNLRDGEWVFIDSRVWDLPQVASPDGRPLIVL